MHNSSINFQLAIKLRYTFNTATAVNIFNDFRMLIMFLIYLFTVGYVTNFHNFEEVDS